ncbi:MAG: outer membrane beta-barrel protein, partial [Chitinophagaceae bacterium]
MSQSFKIMGKIASFNSNKLIFNLLMITFFSIQATAQSKFEVGIALSTMQYEGEIGGRFPYIFNDLHNPTSRARMGGGINLGYHVTDFLSIRGVLNIGSVQAADRLLKPEPDPAVVYKLTRNLSFRSSIVEAGISAEFYPLPILFKRWGQNLGRFNPYIIAGFNVFRFNPRSIYIDKTGAFSWVDLKPLRTEGQGMPIANAPKEYSLISTSIPVGIGVRFNVNEYISLALEWSNRTTFTDYLDDVSGNYIDNAEFDNFFGAGTILADQAKQKANFPSWLNGEHVNAYLPTEPRGSHNKFKDNYYT